MSAKVLLGAMVTVSVLAVAWGARDRSKPVAREVQRAPERPWLSKEAAAQIIDSGTLGPLFGTLTLGGIAPNAEERARIAAFARTNDVAIDLDVVDNELVAIRFEVSYGGCCGYEGAEVLALRAHRPLRGGGCMGGPGTWINNWTIANEDGTFLRARVDHNKVTFRWERTLSTPEVLARADEVFAADTSKLARTAADRWTSLGGGMFVFEVPYDQGYWEPGLPSRLGLSITASQRRVDELSVVVHSTPERSVGDALKAHWGRPTVRDTTWTWRKRDRIIEAEVYDDYTATVTMRRRPA